MPKKTRPLAPEGLNSLLLPFMMKSLWKNTFIGFSADSRPGSAPNAHLRLRLAEEVRPRKRQRRWDTAVQRDIPEEVGRCAAPLLQWSQAESSGQSRAWGWHATGLVYKDERLRGRCRPWLPLPPDSRHT